MQGRTQGSSVLSESPELLDVSSLPVGTSGWAGLDGGVTLLLHTTGLLAGSSETAHFSVLVLGRDDPVDLWVASDSLVGWVNHDDLVELVGGVLTNPVGVQDSQVTAPAGNTLLGDVLVGQFLLELTDTVVAWLTVDAALADHAFAATTADTASVDDVALGSLVAESAGLIGTGGASAAVHGWQLSVLPSTDSEHETHQIGLLLLPELFEVFVGTHPSPTAGKFCLQGKVFGKRKLHPWLA